MEEESWFRNVAACASHDPKAVYRSWKLRGEKEIKIERPSDERMARIIQRARQVSLRNAKKKNGN